MTCHDGFTLYDLVAYDRKHNEANGHGNHDGAATTGRGTAGGRATTTCPTRSVALRHRQLRNAWCLLAMAHGVPMVAHGRRVRAHPGRQQQRLQPGQRDVVVRLGAGRLASPTSSGSWASCWRCGNAIRSSPSRVVGRRGAVLRRRRRAPTSVRASRSLAWSVGDLYVIANAWWEPLGVPASSDPARGGASSTRRCSRPTTSSTDDDAVPVGQSYDVGPARSSSSSAAERSLIRVFRALGGFAAGRPRRRHSGGPGCARLAGWATSYTHGHHESVLRSHTWRTAENSAGYLLGSSARRARPARRRVRAGHDHDRPRRPGGARAGARGRTPRPRSSTRLGRPATSGSSSPSPTPTPSGLPDGSFDVVHAHQVLQHLTDPVAALRRVAPGAATRRPAAPSATATTPGSSGRRPSPVSTGGWRCTTS